MQPSIVTDLLFKQLNFRGEKQKVISTNIANIDTPDYKTKDLRFKTQLDRSNEEYQMKLFNTHAKHMALSPSEKQSNLKLFEVKGLEEQNDGNNVNLDTQMSEMSKNNVMFKAIQNSIKKDSLWFKSIIDASSKN
jgi:flagellar basal-body rod protein FlgB